MGIRRLPDGRRGKKGIFEGDIRLESDIIVSDYCFDYCFDVVVVVLVIYRYIQLQQRQ